MLAQALLVVFAILCVEPSAVAMSVSAVKGFLLLEIFLFGLCVVATTEGAPD